ncbi:MAG: VPLPA-CTERM sorting domain-containing protein [Sedimentitalea sp.]
MKLFIASLTSSLLLAVSAHAATVVEFTSVNGPSVAADVEGTGVTGFDLNRSIGVIERSGGTFVSRDWEEGTNKLSALANNNSIFWGFNSTVGYNLTTLSFGYDRSPTGPVSIAVDFFINNVFQGEIFSDFMVPENETGLAVIDMTAFDNVQNGFFRLTGWGATSSLGTFDIENRTALGGKGITLTGDVVAPIPLPAALPLLIGAIGVMGLGRRRRS